ncbi:MAG: DUF4019 domain-containing protein [Chlamydiales bacterium]
MKRNIILALSLNLALFGQPDDNVGEGSAMEAESRKTVGGYDSTIYNPDYGKKFLDPKDPGKELETMYPQSTSNQQSGVNDSTGVDDRTVGGDFTAANAQATYWLGLIDQQAYPTSWVQAGGLLQDIISRDIWAAAMKEMRQELGNKLSRKVSSHQSLSQLTHGTRGTFIQIKYNSSYSNRANVQEQIILMTSGKSGQWKVISYSIGSG